MSDNKFKLQFEKRRSHEFDYPLTRYFLDAYINNINEPPVLREAKALSAYWTHCVKPYTPDELIAGKLVEHEPVGFHYGSGTWINQEHVIRYKQENKLTSEEETAFDCAVLTVKNHHYKAADASIFNSAENQSIAAHAATSTWFGGHMVIDFETVLATGISGYKEMINAAEIKNESPEPCFYDAMRQILAGIQAYISDYAELTADLNPSLSADLIHIQNDPPETFRQGLQLVWILHLLNGADSFGRFDQYLWPLLESDLKKSLLVENVLDLLACFWIKIEEAQAIQNMTIGGADQNGFPAYNLLTELCLKTTTAIAYKGPNLCLRVRQDIPESVFEAALDCLEKGLGLPALYHDDIYIGNLVRSGVPVADARNYCLAGCSQVMIPGKSNFYNDVGMYNAAKVFEIMLYGGLDPASGKLIGLPTIPAAEMTSFEQLMKAWYEQAEYFANLEVSIHEKERLYRLQREGYAMRSLFMNQCLEKGQSVFSGGALYNHIQLEIIGLTNVADSLVAIKEAVFVKKDFTLPDIMKALENNYESASVMRHKLRKLPKFGNDLDDVDELRFDITKHLYAFFNRQKAGMGGIYVPGEVIFVAHEGSGKVTGATPDGRLAGQILADSAGASQGNDINGPTALMRSVLKLPADQYLLTSIVLNIRFLRQMFKSNDMRQRIKMLLLAFFAQGGSQVQINVVDRAMLIHAQKTPDKYRSLVVRVGGYSEYFVNLSPGLQNDLINRTAHQA